VFNVHIDKKEEAVNNSQDNWKFKFNTILHNST